MKKLKYEKPKARDEFCHLHTVTYFVYILECADTSLYVGCTNNLEKRLKEHNNSKQGAHYTKIRRPVVLKYSETFSNLHDARVREAALKHLTREKKRTLITYRP